MACPVRAAFVGQDGILRPIGNRPFGRIWA